MASSKGNKNLFKNANVRLCRIRKWPEFNQLGFQLFKRTILPATIGMIESYSPAAASGLRIGDILLKVDESPVVEMQYESLVKFMKKAIEVNNSVDLLVIPEENLPLVRNGLLSITSSNYQIIETPHFMPEDFRRWINSYAPRMCILKLESKEKTFGIDLVTSLNRDGTYIQEIQMNSAASRAGVRRFDRIIEVDDNYVDKEPIKNVEEKLRKALNRKSVKLLVADTKAYAYGVLNQTYVELQLHSSNNSMESNLSETQKTPQLLMKNPQLSSIPNRPHVTSRSVSFGHERARENSFSSLPVSPSQQSIFSSNSSWSLNAPSIPSIMALSSPKKSHSSGNNSKHSSQTSSSNNIYDEEGYEALSEDQPTEIRTAQYESVDENFSRPPPIPPRSRNTLNRLKNESVTNKQPGPNMNLSDFKKIGLQIANEFRTRTVISEENPHTTERFYDVECEPLKIISPIEGYENIPILPLVDTLKDLKDIISNFEENLSSAIKKSNCLLDGLDANESAAIYFYTIGKEYNISKALNVVLRDDDRTKLKPYLSYLKLLLTALWKLPSSTTTVWRASPSDLQSKYPVGKTFVWWGFSSCTQSRHHIKYKKCSSETKLHTLFHITSTNAKQLFSRITASNEKDDFLLLPGCQFRVTKQTEDSSNTIIIHIEEIKSDMSFIQSPLEIPVKLDGSRKFQDILEESENSDGLTITHHHFTIEEVQWLTEQLKTNQAWKKLTIKHSSMGSEQIKALMKDFKSETSVVELNLEYDQLDDSSILVIVDGLAENSSIKSLNLSNNKVNMVGARALADLLFINKTLTNLNVAFNSIGDRGANIIFNSLVMCHLSPYEWSQTNYDYLEIQANNETDPYIIRADEAYLDIDEAIRCFRPLNILNLNANNLTHETAEQIGVYMESVTCQLKELSLSYNPLKNRGVRSLMKGMLRNKTIVKLYLDGVEFGDDAIESISNMLKFNSTLQHFSLRENNIGDEQLKVIAAGVGRSVSLISIDLGQNRLTDLSTESLTTASDTNKKLNYVNLEGNQCTESNKMF